MLKQCAIAAAVVAFSSVAVFADTPGTETIYLPGIQGPPTSLTISTVSNQVEAPYALTGQTAAAPVPTVEVHLGQGPMMAIPR